MTATTCNPELYLSGSVRRSKDHFKRIAGRHVHYTDEYLNYWEGIYYRAGLLDLKLPFATFIKDPWRWVATFGLPEPEVSKLKGIKPPRKQKVTPLIRTGGWRRAPPRRRVEIDVVIAPMDGKIINFEEARRSAKGKIAPNGA